MTTGDRVWSLKGGKVCVFEGSHGAAEPAGKKQQKCTTDLIVDAIQDFSK